MTIKRYFEDSYKLDFQGKGLEIQYFNGLPAVVLPETWFYPTSGGQQHDTGFINDGEVIDVVEDDSGKIWHILSGPIPEGDFEASVDSYRRKLFRQQHTGQHILSRALELAAGAETLSSTLGERLNVIDIPTRYFSEEAISDAENLANEIIHESRPVKIHMVTPDELHHFSLRKDPGERNVVRVIEISGFDMTPCGGTHCLQTGEVGVIKVISAEKIKSDRIRISFQCGNRALTDYQTKNSIIRKLNSLLSSETDGLEEKVSRLIKLVKDGDKERSTLKKQLNEFHIQHLGMRYVDNQVILLEEIHGTELSDLRMIASGCMEKGIQTGMLYSGEKEVSCVFFSYHPAISDSANLLSTLKEQFEIKGGGSGKMIQFTANETVDFKILSETIRNWINNRITT